MFDRRNPSPSLLERAEHERCGHGRERVHESALHAPGDRPYAEPGTAAHRLNLMHDLLAQTAEAGRSTERTVAALVEQVHLLKRQVEALEARLRR
jgi:hypothetical protein